MFVPASAPPLTASVSPSSVLLVSLTVAPLRVGLSISVMSSESGSVPGESVTGGAPGGQAADGATSASTGASLTGATSMVIVWADGSKSTPPFAVPPSSWTWNVNEAYAAPLASAAGVNVSRPAMMSATLTNW